MRATGSDPGQVVFIPYGHALLFQTVFNITLSLMPTYLMHLLLTLRCVTYQQSEIQYIFIKFSGSVCFVNIPLPMRATCFAHLTLLDLNTAIICGDYKLRRSLINYFLYTPVTLS
jgi:hypothetical protein